MLDLDKSGIIEKEELIIGMDAIDMVMSEDDIEAIMREVNPELDGLTLVGFIQFMCRTPKYKTLAASNKALILWRRKEALKLKNRKKRNTVFNMLYNYLNPKRISAEDETRAAIVIQTAYREILKQRVFKAKNIKSLER
jgi:hypothetical protein